MSRRERWMLRAAWILLPLATAATTVGSYAFGTWLFGQGQ
jgi:hypothetical protein